jgi:hypothetical protein
VRDYENGDAVVGCKYLTGNFKKQVYYSEDIRQAIKFGAKITFVHGGIGFKKVHKNQFGEFIQTLFNK